MLTPRPNRCGCLYCQIERDTPEKRLHHHINLLMSRLDEQQRRWFAAIEAERYGWGGIRLVSQITGLDEKTIRRGRRELEDDLQGRPVDHVRLAGVRRTPGRRGKKLSRS
jgi:hypothetical protein